MKDRLRKVQFKYLDYLFENTYGVKSKFYPDSTFFKKDDKVILELEKSGTLWVLYSVWGSISDTFSLQYEETQQLIKEWMESQLKQGEVAPFLKKGTRFFSMESQLKLGEVTQIPSWLVMKQQVEAQIKKEEVTPKSIFPCKILMVEAQIKKEEVTPQIRETDIYNRFIESRLELEEVKPHLLGQGWSEEMKELLKSEEVTPKSSLPPLRWTKLKSEEIKPTISTSYRLEEKLKSEKIIQ